MLRLSMKLSDIIGTEQALAEGLSSESLEREIIGLTADSREVKPGFLFAALPGATVDGARFIPNALAAVSYTHLRAHET